MKTILRWIAVIPGSVAAMLVVNIINGFTVAFIFPDVVDEICKAWFGSLVFVMAAHSIAPRGKFVTALVIGTLYAGCGTMAVLIDIRSPHPQHAVWLQILTTVISIAATVFACCLSHAMEKDSAQKRNPVLKTGNLTCDTTWN